jgi:hypothetical protein
VNAADRHAEWTRQDIFRLQLALPASHWLVCCVPDDARAGRRVIRTEYARLKLFEHGTIRFFRGKNAEGYHIYARPKSTRFILIDDLTLTAVRRMERDGIVWSAVVVTSARDGQENLQVWIAVSGDELPLETAAAVSKLLARRYGGDPGSADPLHLGRLPGLRNRKAKYRDANGGHPLVRLKWCLAGPRITLNAAMLLEEAAAMLANGPAGANVGAAPSSSALGACDPTIQPKSNDIAPTQCSLTPDEAREIYNGAVAELSGRFNWTMPIEDRSRVDFAMARHLAKLHGFGPNDIAAVILHGSNKAAERGLEYATITVRRAVAQAL